jgi:hypothetical protein
MPQGRQERLVRNHICIESSADQEKSEPAAFRDWNSAFVILSLSGSRRRALAKTGQPEVSTKWQTLWRGLGVPLPSLTMLGNSARSVRTTGAM